MDKQEHVRDCSGPKVAAEASLRAGGLKGIWLMLLHQARQGCVELPLQLQLLLHVLFLELHLLLLVDFDQLIPLSFKLCHILDLAINELLYMILPAQDGWIENGKQQLTCALILQCLHEMIEAGHKSNPEYMATHALRWSIYIIFRHGNILL